jgi:HD-GYP domain-containing protein (c-di-GMP phosphodiesterase class II)
VASSSRFLLVTAVALVAAAPAYAGNSTAPGVVKKDQPGSVPATGNGQGPASTTTTPAVTPAPAPTAAPQAQPKVSPTAPASGKSHGNTPVNRGTLKKLTGSQPVVTTTTPTARVHTTRRSTNTRRASHTATRPASGMTSTATRRSGAGATAAATRRSSSATKAAATAAAAAALAAAHMADTQRVHRASVAKVKAKKTVSAAPLATISRAADQVVQVIPGALILALAGLSALVILLMIRSVSIERRRSKALAETYGVTVEALATAIEAKDHTTGGHIERVRRLGLLLAAEAASPRETRDPQMAYGFLLHDIGKLAVPDAILRAPRRLTDEEWALMRRHPEEGVRMLSNVPFLDRALDVVHYHHERWDGGGYPEGLSGEEIPLWARIFAVVDALDAITAERPYRPAQSYEKAVEEIRSHAGTQFDPAVVDALERLDPAAVKPLLEPGQVLEPEQTELAPVAPLVAA